MVEDLSTYEYAAYHSILKALALSPASWVRAGHLSAALVLSLRAMLAASTMHSYRPSLLYVNSCLCYSFSFGVVPLR